MSLFLSYCLSFSAVALVASRATDHKNHRNPLTASLLSIMSLFSPPPRLITGHFSVLSKSLFSTLQQNVFRQAATEEGERTLVFAYSLCVSRVSWREPQTPNKLPVHLALEQWCISRLSPHQCLFSNHSLNISVCVGRREKKTLISHALWLECNKNTINCTCQ